MAELQITATGAILYDPARAGKPEEGLFDAYYWEDRKRVVARAQGRGGVLFIRDEHRYWVLRHYRRGGLVGKLIRDAYLWTGLQRTRAFREWHLLHTLHAQGLPVPAPVAARVKRTGLIYRADLITEALPAVRTLADSITGAELLESVWQRVGGTIARFHDAGVHHADLNAHNILLGESGTIYVLDFDRGRIRTRGTRESAVVERLKRSLLKIRRQRTNVHFSDRDWAALMRGYRDRSDE
jgi:3-deoxy-D-manno-octulosonic acid kinase